MKNIHLLQESNKKTSVKEMYTDMDLESNISDTVSVSSDLINEIGNLDYCVTHSIEDSFYTREEIDTMVQELKDEIKDLKDSMITDEDRRRILGVESFFDLHANDDMEETEDIPVLTTESTEDIDDEDLDSDDLIIDDLKDIEFSEKDFGIDPDSFIDPED